MSPRPVAAIVISSPTRVSRRLNYYVQHAAKDATLPRFVARSGINGATPRNAEVLMEMNRRRWGKDETVARYYGKPGKRIEKKREGRWVQAYSVIQSFARDGVGALDPDDPADIEIAHEAGVALAKALAGTDRYATVTTQIDGQSGMIHNHVVMDSISKETGRSYRSGPLLHSKLAKLHDKVLESEGLQQVNELRKSARIAGKGAPRALSRHEAWVENPVGDEPFSVSVLQRRIDKALADESYVDFDGFIAACEKHSVDAQLRGEGGRGISYRMIRRNADGKRIKGSNGDIRRASKLGSDFMMDAVEAAITRNISLQPVTLPVAPSVTPAVTTAPAAATASADNDTPVSQFDQLFQSYTSESLLDPGDDIFRDLIAPKSSGVRHKEVVNEVIPEREDQQEQHVVSTGRSVAEIREAAHQARMAKIFAEADRNEEEAYQAELVEWLEQEARKKAAAAAASALPFVSKLRDVKMSTAKAQARVDALAEYEEEVVPVLEGGGRLDESRLVAIGVGDRLLRAVDRDLHDAVRRELYDRSHKQAEAKRLFDSGQIEVARMLRDEMRQGWYSLRPMPQVKHPVIAVPQVQAKVTEPRPVKQRSSRPVVDVRRSPKQYVEDVTAQQVEPDDELLK